MSDQSGEHLPILSTASTKLSFFDQLFFCFEEDDKDGEVTKSWKISDVDAVFLLLNTMVGAGVLQQAVAFEDCGIASATVLFVVIGYFTFVGARTLSKLADASGCKEYSEIAFNVYGKYGALTVDISIVLFNFTTVLMYVIYMGSMMNDLVVSYVPNIKAWYVSESFLSTLLTICVALPICFVRTFGRLTAVSYLSVFLMILVAFTLIIDGTIIGKNSEQGDLEWYSFTGSLKALGNIVYSLGFSPAVLFTYNSLENKHKKDMPQVVLWALLGGTAICFVVGLGGYILFGNSTESNVILNLSGTAARVCDLAMVVHFALFLPGDFFIFRASLYNLIYDYSVGGRFYAVDPPITAFPVHTESESVNSSEVSSLPEPPLSSNNDGRPSNEVEDHSPLLNRRTIAIVDSREDRLEHLDEWTYAFFTITFLLLVLLAGIVVEMYVGSSSTYFSFFINFVGGLAGSVDSFIMPGFCGLRYFDAKDGEHLKCYVLITFGFICMIAVILGSFLYVV